MIGVHNRVQGVVCEVGTCFWQASHTELVTVIPGDPELSEERHEIEIVLCRKHDDQFAADGLVGIMTAFGDLVVTSREAT